jgi:hypothetical protein
MRKSLRERFRPVLFLIVLTCVLVLAPTLEAADVIENVGEGRINWTQGLVIANGIGAPPKGIKNPAQIRAMTQRAAITVARRNLLEVLKGVRIDSSTTVENFIVASDVIKTQVSGVLQGSQVMQTKYFSDGSVEVTVGIRVTGELASVLMPPSLFLSTPAPPAPSPESRVPEKPAAAVPPAVKEHAPPADKVPAKAAEVAAVPAPAKSPEAITPPAPPSISTRPEEPKAQPAPAPAPPARKAEEKKPPVAEEKKPAGEERKPPVEEEKKPAVAEDKKPPLAEVKAGSEVKAPPPPPPLPVIATGLVVDARGLGLKPALLPRILDERGGEIYSTRQVSRQSAMEQGLVGYAKDVSAAQRNIRVTDKPLLIKGIKAMGKEKTDVVVADSDAATVVAAASASNFLEKSRVIIVYD